MKRYLVLLALPVLAACGDAADESDDPPATESELTTGAPTGPATAGTPDPAATGTAATDPAATGAATGATPSPGATSPAPSPGPRQTATVPPTNQDAQYQDSVTEEPEAAP